MLVCIANSFYLLSCLKLSCRERTHYIRYQKTIYRGSNLRRHGIIKKNCHAVRLDKKKCLCELSFYRITAVSKIDGAPLQQVTSSKLGALKIFFTVTQKYVLACPAYFSSVLFTCYDEQRQKNGACFFTALMLRFQHKQQ